MPSRVVTLLLRFTPFVAMTTLPGVARAHSFGILYNLPMPFWLYAYGATAALLLSFFVTALFAGRHAKVVRRGPASPLVGAGRPSRSGLHIALQGFSAALLLLCLVTGYIGHRNPYTNFSMTFFWIVCVLGLAYATALFGNLYAVLNPWRALADGLARVWPAYGAGRWRYPRALRHWPAFGFYVAFIALELFTHGTPRSLAVMLSVYTAINLLGVGLVGRVAWFARFEFFSVFFALTARLAPLVWTAGRVRLRAPFAGLLEGRARDFSVLLFVLFMLASTAFDGLRATLPWMKLFWQDPFQLITPLIGRPPIFYYGLMRPWYDAFELLSLLLTPWLYLAAYGMCMGLAKVLTGTVLTVRELMLRFAFSLLPIALVYNVTHYFTLLLTQGVKIVSLVSDPFGWGWDLFGTATLWRAPILPGMSFVWHSQVGLILFGHIASVVVAHLEALRTFGTRRQALLSQLPMLLLMVAFTTVGLWILSQPLQLGH